MKKISLLIMGIIMVVIPLKVNASSSVSISCNKEKYIIGEEATCIIKGNSDKDIISVSGSIEVENDSFDIIPESSNIWEGNADDGDVQLYTDEEKTGVFDIATVKIKAKDSLKLESGNTKTYNLEFVNIKFGNVSGTEEDVAKVNKTITFEAKEEQTTQKVETTTKKDEGNVTTQKEEKTTTVGEKNPSTFDAGVSIIFAFIVIITLIVFAAKKRINKISEND